MAQIFVYLRSFNPRAAAKVAAALIEASESLADFPDRGRRVGSSDTRELIASYPYLVRYRITQGQVHILRVRHTARRQDAT